ncbi:MAG: hypothetical protein QM820_21990 [Minicystis sp.]
MLGDLSGKKLDALARTVRDFEARLPALTKGEGAANDAVDALGKDIAGAVGCSAEAAKDAAAKPGAGAPGKPAEGGCAAVIARLKELDDVRVPGGFTQAAQAARARADTLDGLGQAVEGLPKAPAKQKAREETAHHAREAATAFRALAQALDGAAPLQQQLAKNREEAEEAMTRFTVELEAASKLCAPKAAGSASASAAPPASAKPPASPH